MYLFLLILDTQDLVNLLKIVVCKILKSFGGVVCKDDELCVCLSTVSIMIDLRRSNSRTYPTMGASSRLVQRP